MWAQQEQRSLARIVSGAGSLKSPGKRGGADFSPKSRQRACQDPLTRQGGDALIGVTFIEGGLYSTSPLIIELLCQGQVVVYIATM
jgi:hypothetical protein